MHIKIDLKIFLFALIFIITRQIKIYSVMMIFSLIHECGHIIAGLMLGFKPICLNIAPYGFSIKFKANISEYNKKVKKSNFVSIKKIIISIAGPATNLIIVFIVWLIEFANKNASFLGQNSSLIIYSNIIIFIFNIIPMYPLDGGRILMEIIRINKGIYCSYEISQKISMIVITVLTVISSITILIFKNIAIVFIILYLWIIEINNYKRLNSEKNYIKEFYKKY